MVLCLFIFFKESLSFEIHTEIFIRKSVMSGICFIITMQGEEGARGRNQGGPPM